MKINENGFHQETQSVSSMLKNTGDAIQMLREALQDVEMRLLEPTMSMRSEATPSDSLQFVDLLSQSVDEIALLLDRLSIALPETIMIDASQVIAPIRLENLRKVIRHGTDTHLIDARPKSVTEISLF